jgi:hypothetical protein
LDQQLPWNNFSSLFKAVFEMSIIIDFFELEGALFSLVVWRFYAKDALMIER